jgi:mono/diheme cytochrome c family protein
MAMSPTSRVRTAVTAAGFIIGPALIVFVVHAQSLPPAQRMHEHLAQLNTVEYAVVRGDLDDVKEASQALAAGLSMEGLPVDAQRHLADLKAAVLATGKATKLDEAAKTTAQASATCGTCHAALGKTVKLSAPARPAETASLHARMREHYYAIELMSLGIQGPSNELWKIGAGAMKDARVVKFEMKDAALTKDLNEAEASFKTLAAKAEQAKDAVARTAVYGEILNSCGTCHSLHGRVLGPGVPKL